MSSVDQVHGRAHCQSRKLIANFDPEFAGGVSGQIVAKYNYPDHRPLDATIHVDLNLTNLDTSAIAKMYPKCNSEVLTFAWHVHTIWNNAESSGFLGECAPSQTGGHYDPTFACGPASHYGKDPVCQSRQDFPYVCTPETYASARINCEMSDLSGKFGRLQVKHDDEAGKYIVADFHDDFFLPTSLYQMPVYQVPDVSWNIVLHLSCLEAKHPRVLCAMATLV